MKAAHLALGSLGEERAAAFLRERGYEILERNWRYGHLELDLICSFSNEIIFVEIKTRKSERFGAPVEAIGPQKRSRLLKAAQAWLSARGCWHLPCRFDVITCVAQGDDFIMEHYPNAFELSHTLDCVNTHWQP